MAEQPRVAFKLGGLKRPTLNNVPASSTSFDLSTTNNHEQQDFVTGFQNGEIESSVPLIVKQELVIPSQPNAHQQFFKRKVESRPTTSLNTATTSTSDPAVDQLNDDARRALILEARQANEAWDERNENGQVRVHTIAQDPANTFMTNFESDGPTKPEEKEIDNADYDQVPIEEFGMAVLRGMGYKEDAGLGITNKKQVNVFVAETRPRGLGLGADRKVLEKINQLKRNLKQAGIDEKDDLCMEKGAFILVQKGPHQDQYGTIESIEEDTARLTVSLAIGGTNKKKEVISISQYNVKLVTEKEFLKYSKYVNKSKAEQVEKETSDKLMKDYHRQNNNHDDNGKDSKRHRSSKKDDDDGDDDRERRRHHHSSSSHQHRDEGSSRSRRH